MTSSVLAAPSGPVGETLASRALLDRAMSVTPGGVNTARRKIDPPLCVRRGCGDDRVRATIDDQASFGVGTVEVEVAEEIVAHVPSAEQAVVCGSGSEATFHAIRLARGVTSESVRAPFAALPGT